MFRVAITGFLISWIAATTGAAAPYPLPDWQNADLEIGLAGTFQEERGVTLAAVLWGYGWFESDVPRLTKAVWNVWARTKPLQTSGRVSRGVVFGAFKLSPGGEAWWPGRPFRWSIEKETPPYGIISPPPSDARSAAAAMRKRVYEQPIFVSKSVSDGEVIALADFFWKVALESRGSSFGTKADSSENFDVPVGPLCDESGRPCFQNLTSIERASEMNGKAWQGEQARGDDFAMTLSKGGDGCDVIFVRKNGPTFRIVDAVGVDF